MNEYAKNESGIFVPIQQEEENPKRKYPVKSGWFFSMMEDYFDAETDEYRMKALEMLYTANVKQRRLFRDGDYEQRRDLIDQLAVALVGGIPEDWEEPC